MRTVVSAVICAGIVLSPVAANADSSSGQEFRTSTGGVWVEDETRDVRVAALETVNPPEGGTWHRGTTWRHVISEYLLNNSCHGSSVQGKNFDHHYNVPPAEWAKSKARSRAFKVDRAWYKTTCWE